MKETIHIEIKRIPLLHVLTERRSLADRTETAQALHELLPRVADIIAGSPMALQLGPPRDGRIDFELAFPVREPIEREGFISKILPGLPFLSFTHEGPMTGGAEGADFADAWKRFVEFVSERQVLVGDDPARYVYHGGLDSIGTDDERFVLEVLYPYHLPMWLEAFRQGVSHYVDAKSAERVLAGSDGLAEALDGHKAAEWIQAAVELLDEAISDERAHACILNGCAHHYIVQSAEILRAAWDSSGHDLRKLVAAITDEPSLGSNYSIDESGEEALLIIERRPARQEAYDQAPDPVEKRYQACFCPLVRDAIRDGKRVSRTFCHCSGGWYVQEWENVFGEKPEVRLLETMLDGAETCVFAVKIPPGFL
ncbi:GyrI-like domain-containing protein [Candidatus Bipolaricaulota bacterium]|nr:GyrI-like domain-containing protein [Candidatus Bipolaricaulota bacterium]